MKKKIRLLAILMSLAMVFTMMPMLSQTAYADSEVTKDGVRYSLHDDNTATVIGYTDDLSANVVFPETVDGHTVTGIGNEAFDRYKGTLTSISIPKTVTSIGQFAFFNTGLSSVSIDENSELTNIGAGAFQGCGNLKSITIPKKVKAIKGGAFKMTGLETIIFEDGSELTEIEGLAFENCSSLTSITIPSSVTYIGIQVFNGCNALNTVYYEGTEDRWDSMWRDPDWAGDRESYIKVLFSINAYDISFDEQYLVLDDDPVTPYPEFFYDVPVGTTLSPTVANVDSNCYKALYSEVYFNEEKYEYNLIDEDDWKDSFPTKPGIYFCKVEGKDPYYGSFERMPLIRIIDLNDIGNYVATFDDKYLVEDDDPVTPYTEYFYDVPAGTDLNPIVTKGDITLGSECYKASYSEVYFNEEKYEYNLIDEDDWKEEFPTKLGVYFCKVEGKDPYYGSFERMPLIRIIANDISNEKIELSKTSFVYNGNVQKPSVKTVGGKTLKEGTDYTASWSDASSKNAGTYTVTVEGKGIYKGTTKATYTITKATNTLTITAKTTKIKYKKLKKKNQTLAVDKIVSFTDKGQGSMSYQLTSAKKGKKNFKKYFKINKTTGKLTIKKNKKMKKGTYKVKIKVMAAGDANYNASDWKTVTFKVKVK